MIDTEIYSDIKKKKGFKPSNWFEKIYTKEFLSSESIKNRLETIKKEEQELNTELLLALQREKAHKTIYNNEEKRFLKDVHLKIIEGRDELNLLKLFNSLYKRELSLEEFRKSYEHWGTKDGKQV